MAGNRRGSQRYVDKLVRPFRDRILLSTPVSSIVRRPDLVELRAVPKGGAARTFTFDAVALATHSDQSLRLLADPSPEEREILGAISYQENEAVLHIDSSLLPRRRLAWAAWNYHLLPIQPDRAATV